MITLISFIIMLIGCTNWFCIGVLQYDFIAGLFGSQANVFSRIIYALVGICSIWVSISLIKNKGKLKINFKKIFKKHKNEELKNPQPIGQISQQSIHQDSYYQNPQNLNMSNPQSYNNNQSFYNTQQSYNNQNNNSKN